MRRQSLYVGSPDRIASHQVALRTRLRSRSTTEEDTGLSSPSPASDCENAPLERPRCTEANVDDDDDQVLTTDACKINFHGARCRQLVERCIGRSSRQRGQFVNGADLREPIGSGYIKCNADCGRRRLSTAAAKQPRPHRNLSRRDRIARIGAPIERPCLRWSPSMKVVILAGGWAPASPRRPASGPSRWSRSAAGRSSGTS